METVSYYSYRDRRKRRAFGGLLVAALIMIAWIAVLYFASRLY